MKLTPEFLVSFETNITGLISSNWDRVASNLMWDRAMKTRPSATKREILTWLLETAQIYPEGDGGNKRFDDIVAASLEFTNEHAGSGLRLTRDEIEDNQMANPGPSGTTIGALDYAAKWAKDVGAAAAYEPQKQLFNLIKNGTTRNGYDGVPFFSTAHPVNPGTTGGATYSNHIANVPIVVTGGPSEQDNLLVARKNLGKALASVRAQRFVNGVPRFLKPTSLFVQSTEADNAQLIVNAGVIGQTSNTSAADGNDPNKKLQVFACPELDDEPDGVYYIGVEDLLSDELGAFVWSLREEFFMRTFGPMDESVLAKMNEFEWLLDGRNAALYGHPFLFYRCKPGA